MASASCRTNDMDPVEIKIALMRAGVTQADIARQEGVSINAVHLVVHGRAVSDKIRRAIAAAIKTDIKLIWPSTYLYGEPKGPGRPKEHQGV